MGVDGFKSPHQLHQGWLVIWALFSPTQLFGFSKNHISYRFASFSLSRDQQKPAWCVWLDSVFTFFTIDDYYLPHLHMDVLEGNSPGK
jgi:hypothetical protein